MKKDELFIDDRINQMAAAMMGKEREIVEEFCKAFIAHKLLEGLSVEQIFKEYKLCIQHNPNDYFLTKYWMEKN